MEPVEVAVVIITYNSANVIEDLLRSLPAALGDVRARTVIVDNSSSDDTAAIVGARDDCSLIVAPNRGYAAGINIGAAAIPDCEAILILNPDLRLAAGSVPTLLATLRSSDAGIVAPRVLGPDGRLFRSLRREPSMARAAGFGFTGHAAVDEYVSDPAAYATPGVVDWALGAALLVSRACHGALGGWDETFFLYSEETDFCLRAADRGWTTRYVPDAVVTHLGGGSGQSARTYTMQILNRVRLYARRHRTIAGWSYYTLAIVRELSRLARGRRDSGAALLTLLVPPRRPVELGCSDSVLPR